MQIRAFIRVLTGLAVGSISLQASAQFTRDSSANGKIDEAINQHYLMMELDKAEGLLTGTVAACEDKCSPQTKAKAWMYVGIVRGSGKNDQAGASEAFKTAKSLDPGVALDESLATPETKATFDALGGSPSAPAKSVAAPVVAGEIPGDMLCTPDDTDIQTRMPLPISCTTDMGATSAILKFQEYGSSEWKKIEMKKVGEYFQAEVPCNVTGTAGPFKWFVGAKDAAGEYVDQYGSKNQPAIFNLSEAASAAPAFPGQAPVNRCADSSDCPPDFPGCASAASSQQCGDLDWGQSCKNSGDCKCGLMCDGGTCTSAPSCTADSDCNGGTCVDGTCNMGGGEKAEAGPFKRHWLGLDAGVDITFLGGENLCTRDRAATYGSYCYGSDGTPYISDVSGGLFSVGSGMGMGQVRIKLGYDFAITPNIMVGARVGIGLVNTPPSPPDGTPDDPPGTGSSFFPVHGEARFTYNFIGLDKKGFRPAVFVGGGVAEVVAAIPGSADAGLGDVTMYKRAGIGMGGGGLSLGYAIQPNMAIKLDVAAMALFGSYPFSFAIHPSLGFVYGL